MNLNGTETPLQLASRYARLIDDRQFGDLHRVLAPEIRISGPGYVMDSLPQVIAGMELLRQYDGTYHLVANQLGAWEDDEHYVGETYCIASHLYQRDGVARKLDMAIRYQDRIVRTGAGLRFVERELRIAWTQDLPLQMPG